MKILTVGDSFTYGDELQDRNLAWPNVLASMLGGTVVNKGQPGGSNDSIVRICIDHVVHEEVDLVVIGWSSPGRTEFADECGYFDIWPGYNGRAHIHDDASWRRDLLDYINQHNNTEAYQEKFLNQILLMQGFLKSKNIRVLMLNTVQNEYYKRAIPIRLVDHYYKVDKDHFIEFGKSGMMEWTFGSPQGPYGHFLEEGHQIVADKIYDHIRHLGWIS